MNGVCVIYDNDEKYAKRLMNAMSSKSSIPYGIQVFTKEHELISYLDHHKPDMMLVSEDCYSYEVKQRKEGKVIVLMDEEDSRGDRSLNYNNEAVGVYKYQSSENLLKEVIKVSNCNENRSVDQVEMIGVFTPVEIPQRVTFSLDLAKGLSQNYRILYISLEEFSGLSEIIPAKENMTLSDVVYYYRQNSGHVDHRMLGAVCNKNGLDYIAPVQCADDISYIEPEQLIELLQQIAADAGYDKVVVDISYAVKQQWRLLQNCSRIYMPVQSDYLSTKRLQAFEVYFINQGMEKILNKIRKITLPEDTIRMKSDFWEQVEYSELYRFTEELIRCDFY